MSVGEMVCRIAATTKVTTAVVTISNDGGKSYGGSESTFTSVESLSFCEASALISTISPAWGVVDHDIVVTVSGRGFAPAETLECKFGHLRKR